MPSNCVVSVRAAYVCFYSLLHLPSICRLLMMFATCLFFFLFFIFYFFFIFFLLPFTLSSLSIPYSVFFLQFLNHKISHIFFIPFYFFLIFLRSSSPFLHFYSLLFFYSSCITVDDVCELFTEAFSMYLKIKGLKNVYLVGHSFGAYHAINFAEK
jgi:pimeloyl-ACP methyl ester carboxylesterase